MAEGFICRRGGGGSNKSTIIVTAPAGSAVTATMGGKVKTASEKNGQWQFKNCDPGTWTVKASLGASSFTSNVVIPAQGAMLVYYVSVVYRTTPEFTYTGNYKVVDDNDKAITDFANWRNNWKIRFLTSGTLTFTDLHGFNGNIDIFLVGGGGGGGGGGQGGNADTAGGGGGGGYTTTKTANVTVGTKYSVNIGSGGNGGNVGGNGSQGGKTSAFDVNASGGGGADGNNGGGASGGSGGGSCGYYNTSSGGNGGSNGSNGEDGEFDGGRGQGRTTKEFGMPSGTLYSGGGGGGAGNAGGNYGFGYGGDGGGGDGSSGYSGGNGENGATNLGGGGGGGTKGKSGGKGGSGIVIIRNAR